MQAQSASLQMGARAHGMGYASACLSDSWSLTSNVAGIAGTKHLAGAVSYHAMPAVTFLNRMAAVITVPLKEGAAGAGIFRFGDDLYNEHVITAGYANTFGLASLGLKLNYIQYRAEGMETFTALTVSFGGLAELTPRLLFGAHIVNINQPGRKSGGLERVPTRLLAGIAFKISSKVIVATEIEKDLGYTPTLKGGFEYQAFKKFVLRSGFNLHPESAFLGIGFKPKKFDLDYALQLNNVMGPGHQATVGFKFGKE